MLRSYGQDEAQAEAKKEQSLGSSNLGEAESQVVGAWAREDREHEPLWSVSKVFGFRDFRALWPQEQEAEVQDADPKRSGEVRVSKVLRPHRHRAFQILI